MSNWFECVIQYETQHEKTGKITKVKETYLVDAMSFTEAEARIQEKLKHYADMGFVIKQLKPVKFEDIYDNSEDDQWYKCKIVYTDVIDGKEKKNSSFSLIKSTCTETACADLTVKLKDSMIPWVIGEIKEYTLFDYFPYIEYSKM